MGIFARQYSGLRVLRERRTGNTSQRRHESETGEGKSLPDGAWPPIPIGLQGKAVGLRFHWRALIQSSEHLINHPRPAQDMEPTSAHGALQVGLPKRLYIPSANRDVRWITRWWSKSHIRVRRHASRPRCPDSEAQSSAMRPSSKRLIAMIDD